MLQKLEINIMFDFCHFLGFFNVAETWHQDYVLFLSQYGFSKMLQKLYIRIMCNFCYFLLFQICCRNLTYRLYVIFLTFWFFKNVAETWHKVYVWFFSLSGFSKMLQKLAIKILFNFCHFQVAKCFRKAA
jgi:hypothetical protein